MRWVLSLALIIAGPWVTICSARAEPTPLPLVLEPEQSQSELSSSGTQAFGIGGRAEVADLLISDATEGEALPNAAGAAVAATMWRFIPSMHLDVQRIPMRFELPLGFSSEAQSIGGGVYPIFLSFLARGPRVMPFLAGGVEVSFLRSRTRDATGKRTALAYCGLFRGGAGMKVLPRSNLAFTFEIAYSWILAATPSADKDLVTGRAWHAAMGLEVVAWN